MRNPVLAGRGICVNKSEVFRFNGQFRFISLLQYCHSQAFYSRLLAGDHSFETLPAERFTSSGGKATLIVFCD